MKNYKVELSDAFKRKFKKLDRYTQIMIRNWIRKNLENCSEPRITGKPLKGRFKNQWRYRIGDYRLICEIKDSELIILAITVGHRREIYK